MKDKEIKTLVSDMLDEKLKGLPTKDEISEMVGNSVKEAFTKVEAKIQPIVNKKKEKKEEQDEKYNALLKKTSEKTGVDVEVLNGTPAEVLDYMLVENDDSALPHAILEQTDAKLNHSTDPNDEEE